MTAQRRARAMPVTRWFRMVLALISAARGASAEPPLPTAVAVDMRALDESAWRSLDALSLEQRIVVRLVQEGFAVVSPATGRQVTIRIRILKGRVEIERTSPGAPAGREVPLDGSVANEVLHLEIAQKVVELARGAPLLSVPEVAPPAAATGGAVARVPRQPDGVRSTPAVTTAPGATEPEPALVAGAGGGGLWRGGGLDPAIHAALRIGRFAGIDLHAGLTPASTAAVSIVEGQIQGGASLRLPLAPRTALEIGALAGILVHRFKLSDPTAAEPSGMRVDFLASLPVSLALWPTASVGFGLRAAPGLSPGARRHIRDGDPLWQRGAARLELSLLALWRIH